MAPEVSHGMIRLQRRGREGERERGGEGEGERERDSERGERAITFVEQYVGAFAWPK